MKPLLREMEDYRDLDVWNVVTRRVGLTAWRQVQDGLQQRSFRTAWSLVSAAAERDLK